jgi:signal transduction histidine kinase
VEHQRSIAPDRVINLKVSGASMKVEADPVRIEQVLGNLLVNALKYSEPGTEIGVDVHRVDSDVLVSVTNRGPGIPAEQLPKIFERYYRTPRARTGAAPGLGLGLYITKGLIEAHGGRIWAESRLGETTTFQFALPIAVEDVPH